MISTLRGSIVLKGTNSVVIEVGGIGFSASMSTRALSELPALGEQALIWTSLSVREDGISLFGFTSENERLLFSRLTSVSGIGPKVALAALSSFSPESLAEIIALGDVSRMATVPGIGKKTAQRIVLELKGSLDESFGQGDTLLDGVQGGSGDVRSDAVDALLAMGFSSAEVQLALRGYDGGLTDSASVVRYGLRKLGSTL